MKNLASKSYTRLEWFKEGFYTCESFAYTRFCLILCLISSVPLVTLLLPLLKLNYEMQDVLGICIVVCFLLLVLYLLVYLIYATIKQFSNVYSEILEVVEITDKGMILKDRTVKFDYSACPKKWAYSCWDVYSHYAHGGAGLPNRLKLKYITTDFSLVSDDSKLLVELVSKPNGKLFSARLYIVDLHDNILVEL